MPEFIKRNAHRSIIINGERFPWPDSLTWAQQPRMRAWWIVRIRHEGAEQEQELWVESVLLSENSIELVNAHPPDEATAAAVSFTNQDFW